MPVAITNLFIKRSLKYFSRKTHIKVNIIALERKLGKELAIIELLNVYVGFIFKLNRPNKTIFGLTSK